MLSTDTWLKIICSMMINAVVFGVCTVTVLSIPALAANAKYFIPAAVVISFAGTFHSQSDCPAHAYSQLGQAPLA